MFIDPNEGASTPEGEEGQNLENEDPFADLPSEEEPLKEEKDEDDEKKSILAQKAKYRAKYKEAEAELARLKAEKASEAAKPVQTDEREKAAQEYIRKIVREENERRETERVQHENELVTKFQERLDEVLDEHPSYTEDQILDVCEEYTVEPEAAVKILEKLSSDKRIKRPRIPTPQRGGSEVEKPKEEDKNLTLYQIAQKVKEGLRKSA